MTIKIETTDLERRGRNVDAALPPPAPTLFEVAHRRGIWEVTKDGRFYGHNHSQQPPFDAVEAAAHAAVASGGSADILLRGERPWQTASRPSGASGVVPADRENVPNSEPRAASRAHAHQSRKRFGEALEHLHAARH
jgi:hypothetical protein